MKIYVYLIEKNRPTSIREIAAATGLAPSSVHYHLKRMIEAGLVKRTFNGYIPAKIIGIRGYVVIGRKILPQYNDLQVLFSRVIRRRTTCFVHERL